MLRVSRAFRLSHNICRSYATEVPKVPTKSDKDKVRQAQREGRHLSTPKAVRERWAARNEDEVPSNDLSPSEFHSFRRAFVLGELIGKGEGGGDVTQGEWITKRNEKRSRIRGINIQEGEDGQKKVRAMGQKIYLPNIIFRMVRNHTPPGEPYNPFQATFRIPQSVTKTDVRSYLYSVYGVETTYIRTDNYLSPILRSRDGSWTRKQAHKTFKRAVVGLVKPFYYPMAMEDMTADERVTQEKWIEDSFGIKSMATMRKAAYLRMSRRGTDSERWKWRKMAVVSRSQILRAVAEKRAKREQELLATKELMEEARAEGRPVDSFDTGKLHARRDEKADEAWYSRQKVAQRAGRPAPY